MKDHINALQVGEVYKVVERGFWMIGKVIIPNNGDNDHIQFRGDAEMISSKCKYEKGSWCYSDRGRTYKLATPEEKYWLEQCIEKGKYVDKKDIDFTKMQINYEIY